MKRAALATLAAFLAGSALSGESRRDYKKWLKQEVVWIISEKERKAFRQLKTDSDREAFVRAFWKRRDPTPSTERNEYQEEHYRRWEFASLQFQEGVPGWRSDRGRIYIIHGPPDSEYFHKARNIMSPTRVLKSTDRTPDSLVWTYHDNLYAKHFRGETRLVFQPSGGLSRRNFALGESRASQQRADEMERRFFPASDTNWLNGDVRYKLVMAGPPAVITAGGADLPRTGTAAFAKYADDFLRSPGEWLEERTAELERRRQVREELQQATTSNIAFDRLALDVSWESFMAPDGEWMLPVEVRFPSLGLQGKRVDVYASLLDASGAVFDEFLDSLDVPPGAPEERPVRYINSFSLPSGDYRLRVVVREQESRSGGSLLQDLHLDPALPDRVRIGSVFLTGRVEVAENQVDAQAQGAAAFESGSVIYQGVRLLPARSSRFDTRGNLFAFLQIWAPEGGRQLSLSGNFIRDGQIVQRMGPAHFVAPEEGPLDYGTFLPLKHFEPGSYILQLQIVDPAAGGHDIRRLRFEVD